MDALLSVNWIALLVLMIALLSFKALNWIAYRVNWTVVILIDMVIGAVIGVIILLQGEHIPCVAEFNWTGLCKTDQSFGSTGNFSIGYFRTDFSER